MTSLLSPFTALRNLVEVRQNPENPSSGLTHPADWLLDAFGAIKSDSGVNVSERVALRQPTVLACVRVLSETIASLPLKVYRRLPRGKDQATTHPLFPLLHDQSNKEMTSFIFREALMAGLLLWGNAYAAIQRDQTGRILGLWPLHPGATEPRRAADRKTLYYETDVDGNTLRFAMEEVLHIPGLSFDGLKGLSPIGHARQAIGLALATEKFGSKFFGNNARPGGVLKLPGPVDKTQENQLKQSIRAAYSGENALGVLIAHGGVDWVAMSVPPEDAQFLETRKFQAEEIARMFRVPGPLVGITDKASTYASAEQFFLSFVVHTVRPWLVRWEQELNRKLLDGEFFAEFTVDGLLRGDSKARADFYRTLFGIGALSPNQIRELENWNPLEELDADKTFVPLNMAPIGESPSESDAASTDLRPASEPEQDGRVTAAYRRLFSDFIGRVLRRPAKDRRPEWVAASLEPILLSMAEAARGPAHGLDQHIQRHTFLVARHAPAWSAENTEQILDSEFQRAVTLLKQR